MFQFERVKNEERVLARAFPNYAGYIARTARLLPGVY
jgi:protein-S-isoprenylcysteine O-methyltransferase Ste14